MKLLYFWLGRDAAEAAREQEEREQRERELYVRADLTDPQSDE
jgi:hypothetical protein